MAKKPKVLPKTEEADVHEYFINFVAGAYRLTYILLERKEKEAFLQKLLEDPGGLVFHTVNRIDKLTVAFMANRGVKEPILIDDMVGFCDKVIARLKQKLSGEFEQFGLESIAK